MKVVKRDGRLDEFNPNKIKVAIRKANNAVEENERISENKIDNIVQDIVKKRINKVEDIQDFIEEYLVECGLYKLAKKYIVYRYTRALVREANTTDESILSLIKNSTTLEKLSKVISLKTISFLCQKSQNMHLKLHFWYTTQCIFSKSFKIPSIFGA